MSNSRPKALKMALETLAWMDEAIVQYISANSVAEPLECRPGCHFCCFNQPMVTPPEALLIGHHIERFFEPQQSGQVFSRIDRTIQLIQGKSPEEIALIRHELPCIFLNDGRCLVYEVRPAICRGCSSTSAEHCRKVFEARNHWARLRCPQQLRAILGAGHRRLLDKCLEIGCQSGFLFLPEAIREYFAHLGPTDAWFKNARVF